MYIDDGYWRGGRFMFEITVPSNYNIVVSCCMYHVLLVYKKDVLCQLALHGGNLTW